SSVYASAQPPPHDDVVAVVVLGDLHRPRQSTHLDVTVPLIELGRPGAGADLQAQRLQTQHSPSHRLDGLKQSATEAAALTVGIHLNVPNVSPTLTRRTVVGGQDTPRDNELSLPQGDESVASVDDA